MQRNLVLLYGVLVYVLFLGVFLYALGFVVGLVVPKGIDDGAAGPAGLAILVNAGLLGIFAVQHTIMARPGFKRWWTRLIPPSIERSTFVLVTSVIFILTFWLWRPLPEVLWHVEHPMLRGVLYGISFLGFGIVLYSSFLIDHFDLFGLRQVILYARGTPYTPPRFVERSLYRLVRHPLMVGFLICFWSAPTMTQGHLLFALLTTGYILVGTHIEERDLVAAHPEAYAAYRRRAAMFVPGIKRRLAPSAGPPVTGEA